MGASFSCSIFLSASLASLQAGLTTMAAPILVMVPALDEGAVLAHERHAVAVHRVEITQGDERLTVGLLHEAASAELPHEALPQVLAQRGKFLRRVLGEAPTRS
jgi:hypothetical protein